MNLERFKELIIKSHQNLTEEDLNLLVEYDELAAKMENMWPKVESISILSMSNLTMEETDELEILYHTMPENNTPTLSDFVTWTREAKATQQI